MKTKKMLAKKTKPIYNNF